MDQFLRRKWERFAIKKSVDQKNVGQIGTDGMWQHKVPCKEELELGRHADLRFGTSLQGGEVGGLGKLLGSILGNGKLSVWTRGKLRECCNKVEQEDEDRQSICWRALTS